MAGRGALSNLPTVKDFTISNGNLKMLPKNVLFINWLLCFRFCLSRELFIIKNKCLFVFSMTKFAYLHVYVCVCVIVLVNDL